MAHMERAAQPPLSLHPLARVPGSVPAPWPGFIEPCLATPRPDPPAGSEWIHEIQYPGTRTQAHVVHGKVVLYTGYGVDCSSAFASIVQGLRLLPTRNAI